MMQMREMAKQLGMSVDQLTNPAMATVQNQKVEEENIIEDEEQDLDELENIDDITDEDIFSYEVAIGNKTQEEYERGVYNSYSL